MDAPVDAWGWVVPSLVVFSGAAFLVAIAVGAVLLHRRSPAVRAAADAERVQAGSALVRLDDAVAELDLEVGLSGALYDGSAPAALRRARMTAQHVRDAAFEEYRALAGAPAHEAARRARGIRSRTDGALAAIARARSGHAAWMAQNVSAAVQVTAARERLVAQRAELGDPGGLLARLAAQHDRSEWIDAERAAAQATASLADAERLVADAAARAEDPTRSALPVLADAERALRAAAESTRRFEERCRLVTDAAAALPEEFAQARTALRASAALRETLEPADAERLGKALHDAEAELTALEPGAGRRPAATVERIARLRDRLDLAVGDARTAQQRLRGARSALPGALSVARDTIARAEPTASHAGVDARVRLAAAQRELAAARAAGDPVEALDAARRATRHAEDAIALADYDRMTRG
ncbi:hypothetical protein [Microbacterium sp.]|uniref:hypothetical protein n=1 Tax=Microbacterium sp. TaxID=51671 RepID=UPI0039E71D57